MAHSHEHEHEHECDCGCESGVYPPYLAIGTVGFILLAIPLLISGIMNAISFSHGGDVGWEQSIRTVCLYAYVIAAICLLILSAYGLLTGIYAESVMFIIYSVFFLVLFFVIRDTGMSDDAGHMVDFFFGIALLLPVIPFILNREALLSIAAFAYPFCLILSELISYSDLAASVIIFAIGAIASGILLVYIAMANLLYAEGGYEIPLV